MASQTFTCTLAQSGVQARQGVSGSVSRWSSHSTTVSYSTADTLLVMPVSAGDIVTDIKVITTGHPAGTQIKLNIGDSIDPDRYADSLSLFSDILLTGINTTNVNYTYTAADIIRIGFDTAASLTATSTIKVCVTTTRA